jgi:hypothetical protein
VESLAIEFLDFQPQELTRSGIITLFKAESGNQKQTNWSDAFISNNSKYGIRKWRMDHIRYLDDMEVLSGGPAHRPHFWLADGERSESCRDPMADCAQNLGSAPDGGNQRA